MRLSAQEAFASYGDRIFAAAYSVLRNREDADDVVQDTFVKYCATDKEFTDCEHLKAWLLRLAINRAKDLLRQFWRRNTVSWDDYEGSLEFQEPEDRTVFQAVMALPVKYRTAIHLYYYEEYSIAQIAQLLHCSQSAIKSQLSRGRKILKTKLTEEWDDE